MLVTEATQATEARSLVEVRGEAPLGRQASIDENFVQRRRAPHMSDDNLYFSGLIREDDCSAEAKESLAACVEYDPVAGTLKRVGSENPDDTWIRGVDNFKYIRLGKHYSARRIAYLCMTGEWPKNAIFHVNGDRSDIRWENLTESAESGERMTGEEVRKRLAYNPETGELLWKEGVTGSRVKVHGRVGKEYSNHGKDYLLVGFDGRHFNASTLIWLIEFDRLPNGPITYLDGDGLNNRLANLCEVSPSFLGATGGMRKNNTSGFKGVSWSKGMRRWHAYIKINRKRFNLGYYPNPKLAAMAYDEAAIKAWGRFAATNMKLGAL